MVDSPEARILVLEDDPAVAQTTAAILRRAGLTVHTAGVLEEAVELCERLRFDVVILDHHLAEASSEDFLEECPNIGLAIIVSAAMPDVLVELQWGHPEKVFAIRSKPCEPDDLVEVVEAAITKLRGESTDGE